MNNGYPYYGNASMYNPNNMYYGNSPYPTWPKQPMESQFLYPFYNGAEYDYNKDFSRIHLRDYGPEPFVVDIEDATEENDTFRTALWTGNHLQVTLMSIDVGEDIGLEVHSDLDQFIRIEDGEGLVMMGPSRDNLNFQARVKDDYAFIIPAGTWHNLINTGHKPIKLYSIYAPPEHPFGTVHRTKAEAAEEHHY